MKLYLICLFTLITNSFADIKSTNGSIRFDVQNDQEAEMTLNTIGLGLGVTPSANLHIQGNAIISNQLSIGALQGSSNLHINGSMGVNFQTVSSNTTLGDSSYILVDSSSDNITLTLPYAGNVSGRVYHIKKITSNNQVLIQGGGAIDGNYQVPLSSGNLGSTMLISRGSQHWNILSLSGNNDLISYEITTLDGSDGVSGFVRHNDANAFGSQITVKNAGDSSQYTRKGYIRFDISTLNVTASDVSLDLTIDLNDGSNTHTLYVYGLQDESLDSWDSSTILYDTAPGNDNTSGQSADTVSGNAILLDSFTVSSGEAIGEVKSISGTTLTNFINADTNGKITFILGRSSNNSSENIGFQSEDDANPPKLIITP